MRLKNRSTQLNEPTITEIDPEITFNNICSKIEALACKDLAGEKLSVFNDNARLNLTIKRGSLNPLERKEIESHVVHTHTFVSKIPWPTEFRNIPEIALSHHETLDGRGYPNGLKGTDMIPLPARIMSIADIYDALTAADRPYKKAMPHEKAVDILCKEADAGKIDKDILDVFY